MNQFGLLIAFAVLIFSWWATYTILGGKLEARYPYMPRTWASTWRSFLAGIVALALFALAGSAFIRGGGP